MTTYDPVDWSNPVTWVPALVAASVVVYYVWRRVRKDTRGDARDDRAFDRTDDFAEKAAQAAAAILATSNQLIDSLKSRLDSLEEWKVQMEGKYHEVLTERNDLLLERVTLRHRIHTLETEAASASQRIEQLTESLREAQDRLRLLESQQKLA